MINVYYAQYYVNRSSGMLYFYPPPQWKSGQVCNKHHSITFIYAYAITYRVLFLLENLLWK